MQYSKYILLAVAISALFTGCSTVDSAYNSSKSIGQSAIGGVGSIVGNSATDASKTLGVASSAAGKALSGAGSVLGGALDLAGGLVKGASDVVAPATAAPKSY